MKKEKNTYTVGYGKPPKASQFKPGQSGNPKGRPKGAREFRTVLNEELKQSVTIREGGRTRKVSKLVAMVKAQVAKACSGDHRAVSLIFANADVVRNSDQMTSSDQEAFDQLVLNEYFRHAAKPNRK